MVGKGTCRLFVSDPRAGQVAFIGTLREENQQNTDGAAVLIALRLKVENRRISEIELFVVRNENAAKNCEKLGMPNHLFLEAVPPGERMSRADLVKTANMYFTPWTWELAEMFKLEKERSIGSRRFWNARRTAWTPLEQPRRRDVRSGARPDCVR